MSSRVASTFAVAVAVADCRPARDRNIARDERRNAALLGIILPYARWTSCFVPLAMYECQAGTGADGELADIGTGDYVETA